MLAQIKALMSVNGTSKPLVLALCCSECGGTAVDSSGMGMMQYPANVRVMKVPCTGILQVYQFLEAFKAGAEGVMVVGCKSDGCHYEVGSQKAEKKVELARALLKEYGIELVDIRIKRINYDAQVRQKVFDRMISERKRAAELLRAEGEGERAQTNGKREKELQRIRSEAYRQAQIIRGKADAEAIKIYAEAYSKDPEFYSFLNTLGSYHATFDDKSTLVLTTDSEYFKYIKDISPE